MKNKIYKNNLYNLKMRRQLFHGIRSNGTIKHDTDGKWKKQFQQPPKNMYCTLCCHRRCQSPIIFSSKKAVKKQKGRRRKERLLREL